MKKFISVVDFMIDFCRVTEDDVKMRIMSIGTTSDGYYTFRCTDDYGNEKVFKVSQWEKKKIQPLDRVEVLEHAIKYGNAAAVDLLKSHGPDNYIQTRENYEDLLYLLTGGEEGAPLEDL